MIEFALSGGAGADGDAVAAAASRWAQQRKLALAQLCMAVAAAARAPEGAARRGAAVSMVDETEEPFQELGGA